jgi:hypothetical protein
MAATSARTAGARDERTPAQWYCLLGGAALLLAGIVGFIADSGFDTGSNLDGDKLIGIFEVNGWHNVVHVLSGLLLLGASSKRTSAKTVAIGFGVVYGIVALYGLIDGSDVIGLIPINGPDNVLHIALAAAGILAGVASRTDEPLRTTTSDGHDRGRISRTESADPLTGRSFEESGRTPTNR